jgi:hypothetical protein
MLFVNQPQSRVYSMGYSEDYIRKMAIFVHLPKSARFLDELFLAEQLPDRNVYRRIVG